MTEMFQVHGLQKTVLSLACLSNAHYQFECNADHIFLKNYMACAIESNC